MPADLSCLNPCDPAGCVILGRVSTDLYGIRVLDLDPEQGRVRLRVFVVYYDTSDESHQPVPSDRSFFVRVLCDKEALGDDIADDERFDEAYVDANAFRFVDRFVELERRNHPVADWSKFSDFYYEREGGWVDEGQLVQADYDVFVTKPHYVDASRVGESWGTTAYPTHADGLSLADYPALPDFGDVRWFRPFPDAPGEQSTATKLLFSAEGERLLVADGEGGFGVFRVADGERLLHVREAGGWQLNPGWTADGRIAGWDGKAWQAWTLDGRGPSRLDRPFGVAGDSTGQRLVAWPADEALRITDAQGNTLYASEGAPDLVIRTAWDSTRSIGALGVEGQAVRILDLDAGTSRELPEFRHSGLAMSPDGNYLAVASTRSIEIRRVQTGELLRRDAFPSGYATGVAWSPDGTLLATTATDDHGYHSRVFLHRIGRLADAARSAPLTPPEPRSADLRDLVRLYLERTADFSRGWASHLDDDKLDMHLALIRERLELDLVPTMTQAHMQIAARAYEAQLRHTQGDEAGARVALADALARLADAEPEDWWATYVHAPLAAAQHLLGEPDAASESLARAHVQIDDEANPFQKRAILGRALLAMGRVDELETMATATEVGWVSGFHLRLISDLIDHRAWGLLQTIWRAWNCADEWDATQLVDARAKQLDDPTPLRAALRDEDETDDDDDHEDDDANDHEERPESPEGLDAQARLAWLAAGGRWGEVYDQISATKPTLRGDAWTTVLPVATRRRDMHVLLDVLTRLPCTDMNAPGLRALQEAFRTLAGPSYRPWHP